MVLSKGNKSALTVSPEAEQYLRADNPALSKFASRFDQASISNDLSGCSDSRAVAVAVNAEIQNLTPILYELGEKTPICPFVCLSFVNIEL